MIYLDNAATTKPHLGSFERAKEYIFEKFYNPSALYNEGYNVQKEIKESRNYLLSTIADTLNYELVFTSCGTEADNLAIFSCAKRGNVVTTLGEHSAVFNAVNELKQRGIEVRFANLNQDGTVNMNHLISLIDDKTSLVSIIHVNNEVGAINDVNTIAKVIKLKSKNVLVHVDGVQAFGKIKFRISKDIDLYSVSAHKIGGIKGCGALIKRKSLSIKPQIIGGGQEMGLRSGTENVFAIKLFEYAAKNKFQTLESDYKYVEELNILMRNNIDNNIFKIISKKTSSPYILSVIALGVRGETIMHELNDNGVIVGTGSACSSNAKKRFSRVILACGIDESLADGVLRISFSVENTKEEVLQASKILNQIVKNRREIMQ